MFINTVINSQESSAYNISAGRFDQKIHTVFKKNYRFHGLSQYFYLILFVYFCKIKCFTTFYTLSDGLLGVWVETAYYCTVRMSIHVIQINILLFHMLVPVFLVAKPCTVSVFTYVQLTVYLMHRLAAYILRSTTWINSSVECFCMSQFDKVRAHEKPSTDVIVD